MSTSAHDRTAASTNQNSFGHPRDDEFRRALDAYIADYAAFQKRRSEETLGRAGLFENLATFAKRLYSRLAVLGNWLLAPVPTDGANIALWDGSAWPAVRSPDRSPVDASSESATELFPMVLWFGM